MAGWFELKNNDKGQYWFVLKAANSEVILTSGSTRVRPRLKMASHRSRRTAQVMIATSERMRQTVGSFLPSRQQIIR